jgi:hypothetical protein
MLRASWLSYAAEHDTFAMLRASSFLRHQQRLCTLTLHINSSNYVSASLDISTEYTTHLFS